MRSHHKLGGIKQQKFILAQFQRLEVQNQGVIRAVLLWLLVVVGSLGGSWLMGT